MSILKHGSRVRSWAGKGALIGAGVGTAHSAGRYMSSEGRSRISQLNELSNPAVAATAVGLGTGINAGSKALLGAGIGAGAGYIADKVKGKKEKKKKKK